MVQLSRQRKSDCLNQMRHIIQFNVKINHQFEYIRYEVIINSMSLQLIIQEIIVQGNFLPNHKNYSSKKTNNQDFQQLFDSDEIDNRRFRITFGPDTFISKFKGRYNSSEQLFFNEPCTFIYDSHNQAYLLQLQIFVQHKFGDNSEIQKQITGIIDLAQNQTINGQFISIEITDFQGRLFGKAILKVEFFKKGPKYIQKISSYLFIQQAKQKKQQYLAVSSASKNIKNLLFNNSSTNFLITISSLHFIFEKEDASVFGRQCFLMIKQGTIIKTFSKVIRIHNKESISWIEYHEFMKNDAAKFVFYLLYWDEYNNVICRAIGQIRSIIYDKTINNQIIAMFDQKSNKYGNLMVKFEEREVQKINLTYKLDRRMRQQINKINLSIQNHNRIKFELKYNNQLLSHKSEPKIQDQDNNRSMNPEQLKRNQIQQRFIECLQKCVIQAQKNLLKKQQLDRYNQKKEKFLPIISNIPSNQKPNNRIQNKSIQKYKSDESLQMKKRRSNAYEQINSPIQTNQYRNNKVKFPKI